MSEDRPVHELFAGTLDASAHKVVARARTLLEPLLDEIRAELVPLAGHPDVAFKSDGTPVTPHDRSTDERLTSRLLEAFPDHGAISEEAGHTAPGTDWTWVLDPIDGTSNFIAGVPYWCVSVALCLEGSPVLGVVEAPPLGLRFSAVAGGGAVEEGPGYRKELRVASAIGLHDPSATHVPGLYSGGAARDLTADGVALNARLLGAAALDLAMVARGSSPLAVTLGPHVWDIAAAGLLVIESGGAVLGASSRPLLPLLVGRDYGSEIVRTAGASDAAMAREALAAVGRGRVTRRQSWGE
jgi:myo-inositol-1(or 4)-monophosphatase